MTDVQVTVGFGRETGVDLHTLKATALGNILVYKILNEILARIFHVSILQIFSIEYDYIRLPRQLQQ